MEDKKGIERYISIRKGREIEDSYELNFQVALSISLVAFILMFLGVRNLQIKPYEKKAEQVTRLEEMPEMENIEEPPPPPPKPKVQVEVEEAQTEEEAQEEEVEVQETVSFDEFETPPPPAVEQVYEIYEVQVPPQIVVYPKPQYPELARKAGIEGKVVVQVVVDEQGNVVSARILKSDNEVFNQAALEAAKKCKFKPAMMNDRPVRVRVNIPFNFHF